MISPAAASLSAIHRELMTLDGMAHARTAIVKEHPWFLHASRLRHFESVKQLGILPRNPYIDDDARDDVPSDPRRVICLRPIFSEVDTTPKRDHDLFVLAVRNTDLPARIGIDWSFPSCGELVDILKAERPERDSADIFAEVVRRRGSVVSYDPIPLEMLRVRLKDSPPADPDKWPHLSQVSIESVHVIPAPSAHAVVFGSDM